ncbi:hypothetical protein FRB99_005779 [Tulasnella sp. 403]|nr:hypothetical protein FRB99_005779 [Tulasnella sp. 403]
MPIPRTSYFPRFTTSTIRVSPRKPSYLLGCPTAKCPQPPERLVRSFHSSLKTMAPTKIAFYSSKQYDRDSFNEFKSDELEFNFLESRLSSSTASLAKGNDAVCIFVNDRADGDTLARLKESGVNLLALRATGADNVDLKKAKEIGIKVVSVPSYSPDAVAEFATGMMLTVVRKYHKSYNRVREGNFLLEGLLGFNLKERTIGVIGTGAIGLRVANILAHGFGAKVLAYDPQINDALDKDDKITYVPLERLFAESDIITLHSPLLPATKHMVNGQAIDRMKKGVILINTSRGGLIDTKALIQGLKSRKVGAVGLDVYEGEGAYFFEDRSESVIEDDQLARLLSFSNVFVSGHQAFLTKEASALEAIAKTTIANVVDVLSGKECPNIIASDA